MSPTNRPFSLLIKPASADCNQRCAYCFYLDRASLYPGSSCHRMADDVLERIIASYMATEQRQYVFGWQGGEPTLMGLDFFRRVTAMQMRYGRKGAVVANGLQTNATLLDDEFCAHLSEFNFLVGVSLDGPAGIHDRYRRYDGGRGAHVDALRGIEILRRHTVEFNVLTLVSAANVTRGREVYRYLRDLGVVHHQYIPCVEWDPAERPLPYAISGATWGEFLCDVFDEWSAGDISKVSVRLFDALLSFLVTGEYEICHLGGDCRRYFVVEYNGDIYPCDFFVREDLRLGNIMRDTWQDLLDSPLHAAFSLRKTAWPERCTACRYLSFCSGDCQKHRPSKDSLAGSRLCEGWLAFFQHALPRLEELAREIRGGRQGSRLPTPPAPGRNDPCFCGSGRKYKKCHGSSQKGAPA